MDLINTIKTPIRIAFFSLFIAYGLLALFFTTVNFQEAVAQGDRQVVRFSGLVVQGDSAYGVPGVHLIIKNAGRGAVTNSLGYFNMFVRELDTIQISSIGYTTQFITIPKRGEPSYSLVIDLKEDRLFLEEVEVFPYTDPEVFKEAFLALELDTRDYDNMQKNLDPKKIQQMSLSLPMSSTSNHRMVMDQRISANANRFFAPTYSFLNPFAWRELIRSIKRGDFKKKDDDDD